MRTEIAKSRVLRPLAVLSCLAACAGPLAAVEDVELWVTPERPYDEPVTLHFQAVAVPCIFEIFAHDNSFDLAFDECQFIVPPEPALVNIPVEVGRLAPGTYQMRVLDHGLVVETHDFTVRAPLGTCRPAADVLCLGDRRFEVRASWQANGQEGRGQAVEVTRDTGRLSFFSAGNVEMVVKVLDACALDGRFWVFAGGLTNVRVVLTVTDTETGAVRTYENPAGTAFAPIQDTAAFLCP